METIDLKLDEQNELTFKVVVEGMNGGTAKVRFSLTKGDMSFTFPGNGTGDGEVSVKIPALKSFLSEGMYDGRLEIIADDRYFEPLHVNVDMKTSIKILEATFKKTTTESVAKKTTESVAVKAEISSVKSKDIHNNLVETYHIVPRRKTSESIRESLKKSEIIKKK